MMVLSKNNSLVKELASLKEKKYRRETGRYLVEGKKMVQECLAGGQQVIRLILREDCEECFSEYPQVRLTAEAFEKVCDAETPQGIAAEVAIPGAAVEPPKGRACLFLDGVRDPANVGAAIRTANAAGYGEVYLADCADPYSPKSVRASMSGIFFVNVMQGSREQILHALNDVPLIAADMNGESIFSFCPPQKFCLCIGNEANGLSDSTRLQASYFVKIPMRGSAESLNAAVSSGILMYLLNSKSFK